MQTVIYADLLFVLNTVMTLLIIVITSDILRFDSVKIRYIAGALSGGAFSLVLLAPSLNIIFMLILRAVICSIIVLLSFEIDCLRNFFRCFLMFIGVSILLAGVMYFIGGILKSSHVSFNNGYVYIDFGVGGTILLVTAVFLLIRSVNKKVFNKQMGDIIFNVKIEYSGKEINLRALYDSGNNVTDMFTGRPVIIVSDNVLSDYFEDSFVSALAEFSMGNSNIEIPEKVRLLPVRTLGSQMVIPAFTADSAVVSNSTIRRIIHRPTIAVSGNSFDKKNYSALINESVVGQVM